MYASCYLFTSEAEWMERTFVIGIIESHVDGRLTLSSTNISSTVHQCHLICPAIMIKLRICLILNLLSFLNMTEDKLIDRELEDDIKTCLVICHCVH